MNTDIYKFLNMVSRANFYRVDNIFILKYSFVQNNDEFQLSLFVDPYQTNCQTYMINNGSLVGSKWENDILIFEPNQGFGYSREHRLEFFYMPRLTLSEAMS